MRPPNRLWRFSLLSEKLVDVCLGRVKADLVLKCRALLSVSSGEILDNVDVAVKDGRIAYVGGNADSMVGLNTEVVRIRNGIAVPGLIDAHTHIDLVCTPTEQAGAMLAHGTTTLFTEPDELASVLGLEGLRMFVEEVRRLPLKVYVMASLTAPQDPEVSSAGVMPLEAYKEALSWPDMIGLGETVAWTLILNHDGYYMEKFKLALKQGKLIEGHTAGARNAKLAACVCSGVSSCHESIDAEQALERLRLGLFLMVREGSLRRDLPSILPDLVRRRVDLSNVALVTDWVDPADLLEHGYMDYVVGKAVEHGVDPVKAVQMVTINPARRFRVDGEVGIIAPGRYASLTVLESLRNPKVLLTVAKGAIVAWEGKFKGRLGKPRYPRAAFETMKVPRRLKAEDFRIKAPSSRGTVKAVVAKLEDGVITRKTVEEVKVVSGEVKPNPAVDLAKIAVVDRHHNSVRIGLGLVKGFGAKVGAVASSLNFDENQLVLVGYSDTDMARAANEVVKLGGGIVVADEGRLLEVLAMPIAGVMSDGDLLKVAGKLKKVNRILAEAGCPFSKPLNVLLFSTFVTLPEIRFTDRGIVDVKKRRYIPLFTG